MGPIRRFGAAVTVAATLAGGLFGSASLEAKGKGGDAHAAYCAYLEQILSYPYLSPYIREYVLSLWKAAGCDNL